MIFLSRCSRRRSTSGSSSQTVYVYHFLIELWHLIAGAAKLEEAEILLTVLGLIDVVMIANLLIMVIVGGYETSFRG